MIDGGTVNAVEPDTLLDTLPDPQMIRERLSKNVRENNILRQMLRLSERAAKEKEARKAVQHAR